MTPTLAMGLVAATAITGVLAVYQILSDLFLRDRSRVSDRVDMEFLKSQREKTKKSPLFKNLSQSAAAAMEEEAQPTIQQRFAVMVDQSGMNVTPGRILVTASIAAGVLGIGCFAARGSPVDGAIGASVAFLFPIWRVKKARDARIEKLRSQLADAFELMARVVRAGQTLGQAMLSVADEFPQPISYEFAYCYEQQNMGLSPEATFRDLTRRTGVIELKIFVLAVLVQQQTGGNLAELLLKLASVVRERYLIRGTIQTLTAEGRMQGWILAALPPLMFLLLFVLNPTYARIHLAHRDVLMGTFAFELMGVLFIRKIVNFDF